ncbi:MAG: tRNA 2-thiouridine(34) synthase MnmA [SAR324 cluster bacterium]|nr:tRNA 2-thiouridine(34) synthase MnmA [SAR324 cluster bacterium]
MKGRVAMAMSGGVDSSVAATLLKEQGYEIIGLHMKLYHGPDSQRQKSCCSLDEAMDARAVCHRLDIPFYVIDFQEEFQTHVIDYFINEYTNGRTPNPCVKCNQNIKSRYLLQKADELECDYLATGHYAKIVKNPESGRLQLVKPADLLKDQTYFLYGIQSSELHRLLFPLQDYVKTDVRGIADQWKLASAFKPDSQEICFVSDDYRQFLQKHWTTQPEPGNFVNTEGKLLGTHKGLPFYTVGQRRGLGVSAEKPYYVIRLDQKNNQVVLGQENQLYAQTVHVQQVNWVSIDPLQAPVCANVKLRYSHQGSEATLIPLSEDTLRIELHAPAKSVTPGQAAVFYQDDVLLGGGWIERSEMKTDTV